MLNLINEELMAYSTITTNEKGKSYTKIKVATSNKLQQYENDSRNNRNNPDKKDDYRNVPKKTTGAKIVSNADELKPIDREIIRISAPLKNIGDFIAQDEMSREINFDLPMSINVDSTNKYQPRVEVRCHEQGDDRANLYVVAFPFNGMIKPIPVNPQYRIYRGLIASSARSFFFNNRKYRKVLYLVIEVNKNLFNPDHKYHTDKIDIQLESYALFTDRDTNEKKTNCEVFKLSVVSAAGDYTTEWEYNTVDEAIMMTIEPGQQLWTTYDMNAYRDNKNLRNNCDFKKSNSKQKTVTYEGDMLVTTNKHGIRKEIMLKNNNSNHNNSRNQKHSMHGQRISTKNSYFDKPFDSDKYDDYYDDNNNNRGRKNNGKRNKSRGKNRDNY